MIHVTLVSTDAEMEGILKLQKANRPENLTEEQVQSQGFVTVVHSLELLKNMNVSAPSVVAKDGNQVIGYCIVMLPEFKSKIPILEPMFGLFEQVFFEGKPISNYRYVVGGQVCVAEGWRGQQVFDQLYLKYREAYGNRFDLLLTEIASRNVRSLRAHWRIGFKTIHTYEATDGEVWQIVVWDWRKMTLI